MVIWGGIGSAVTIALLPATGGFWPLLIVYISVTIGQAFGIPAANAYVVHEGRTYGMGASMTMFMMAMQTGNGIGPIVLGSIADGSVSTRYSTLPLFARQLGVALFAWMVRGSAREPIRKHMWVGDSEAVSKSIR